MSKVTSVGVSSWQLIVSISIAFLFQYSLLHAQEERHFGMKGTNELGGSASFQSTSITDGGFDYSYSTLIISPYFGWFLADGFELGLNPISFATSSGQGSSSTQLTTTLAPAYNFVSDGKLTPFMEGLLGFTLYSGTSGYQYGFRFGLKDEVVGHVLVNVSAELLTSKISESTQRKTIFLISMGLTAWE